MSTTDIIGFSGVFLLLLAFFLNLVGILKITSTPYLVLNLAGSGMACLASVLLNYLPFIILEAAWAAVSMVALVRKALLGFYNK
jgi:hypothetical protein